MVVMSKYGMRFLNTVIKIRFDRSDHSSIPLAYGAFHFLQMLMELHTKISPKSNPWVTMSDKIQAPYPAQSTLIATAICVTRCDINFQRCRQTVHTERHQKKIKRKIWIIALAFVYHYVQFEVSSISKINSFFLVLPEFVINSMD